jgi:hypothetical protein
MGSWDGFIEAAEGVPSGVWMLAAIVAVVGSWRVAGRRMRAFRT